MPRNVSNIDQISATASARCDLEWADWFVRLSSLVAQFHDTLSIVEDEDASYRNVLIFDSKIRSLHFAPAALLTTCQDWRRWAKQEATVCRANKIAFVHRWFFMKSLSDDRFAFSRWACVEAARTIVQEVLVAYAAEDTRPRLWNDQVMLCAILHVHPLTGLLAGAYSRGMCQPLSRCLPQRRALIFFQREASSSRKRPRFPRSTGPKCACLTGCSLDQAGVGTWQSCAASFFSGAIARQGSQLTA